jgi:hypothetical protein
VWVFYNCRIIAFIFNHSMCLVWFCFVFFIQGCSARMFKLQGREVCFLWFWIFE